MLLKLKPALAFLFLASASLLFHSCKKTDADFSTTDSDLQKSKEWAAKQTKFTTHVVNQKLVTNYVDENDKIVTNVQRLNRTSSCEALIDPEATLSSWAATDPQCSPAGTYQIYAVFTISSQNEIVDENPNNTSQKTRGRVVITNASTGSAVFTDQNVLPVSITNMGADPNRAGHTLYQVTWTAQNLPSSVFDYNNKIDLGIYYYSDCEDESRFARLATANIANLGGLSECNVVNYVTVDHVNHFIHGNAAVSTCIPDFAPNYHQVKFERAGFSFTKVIGLTQSYQPTTTEVPRGYTYKITYRNQLGSNINSPTCEGPWIAPALTLYW
ncbi:MAG TPA: hypothetical protein VMR70_01175 [Flavisolibacter sp.]|nr:hypothetical protein [Flavisolibacter sp.]